MQETTLEAVVTTVHASSQAQYDEIIALDEIEFQSLTSARIAGRTVEVLGSAQRLLAGRLKVPHPYLARCPQELQAQNLNYWLAQERKRRETFFCRFDGSRLRAVFTERYTAIDHMEVLTQMLEYGFNPGTRVQFTLDPELMLLRMPEYERLFQLTDGDRIVPGISIANSEVGIVALSSEAFFYRLVCSNGLISKTAVDARYKHISRRALDEFPLVLEGVIAQSRNGRDRFVISAQTPVSNPIASIESFARQFQLSQVETEVVRQAYLLEQGATMFHVINAFTRAAQAPGLSPADAYRLERIGGQALAMVKP